MKDLDALRVRLGQRMQELRNAKLDYELLSDQAEERHTAMLRFDGMVMELQALIEEEERRLESEPTPDCN